MIINWLIRIHCYLLFPNTEIHIGIYNTSHEFQIIEAGTKLVQFIHVPIYLTEPEEVTNEEFYNDAQYWGTRGNNGFGSTN